MRFEYITSVILAFVFVLAVAALVFSGVRHSDRRTELKTANDQHAIALEMIEIEKGFMRPDIGHPPETWLDSLNVRWNTRLMQDIRDLEGYIGELERKRDSLETILNR